MSENSKKRVLITGASQGFGLGATKALAERGHTVFATMRGVSGKNRAAADELRAWAEAGGHAVHVLELDVTDDASVDAAAQKATADAPLDTVINNAGVGTFGIAEGFSTDQLRTVFDVNVLGPLRVNRAVLPSMRKAGKGHIVFVSSGLGRVTMPFLGPYGATKYAVEALGDASAMELSPLGIKTTIVQPGAYGTGFGQNSIAPSNAGLIDEYGPVKQMWEGFNAYFQELFEKGTIGDPKEVVDALVQTVESSDPPLRVPVGKDMKESVDTVNAASDKVQAGVRANLGLS